LPEVGYGLHYRRSGITDMEEARFTGVAGQQNDWMENYTVTRT
jgi:hypothetical protein